MKYNILEERNCMLKESRIIKFHNLISLFKEIDKIDLIRPSQIKYDILNILMFTY